MLNIDELYNEDKTELTFGDMFNQSLDNVKFLDGLQSIIFDGYFNHSLDNVKFPDGLQSIIFSPWCGFN